jgi:hypothetical protein
LVQVIKTPTVLLHCHSALIPESAITRGRASPAAQARAIIVSANAMFLRVQYVLVMVFPSIRMHGA